MNRDFDSCYLWDSIWTLQPPYGEPPSDFSIYSHITGSPTIPDEVFRERDDDEMSDSDSPTGFNDWMENTFIQIRTCPYCESGLDRSTFYDDEEAEPDPLIEALTDEERHNDWSGTPDLAFLWSCPRCTYWQWCDYFENRGEHGSAATSVLAKFDSQVPEGCWSELAQHLRRNPAHWHGLDPKGMEQLVAAIFRSNYSHAEVMHVGHPGDGGIDVLFVDTKGTKTLISVKRREQPTAVEGVETLRSLLGTLVVENEFRGVIASNAHHFSYQAQRDAAQVCERGAYKIELLDRGKLTRMLGPLLPDRPWRDYLRKRKLPEVLVKRFISETTSHCQPSLFE
jgi:hypothetical protein